LKPWQAVVVIAFIFSVPIVIPNRNIKVFQTNNKKPFFRGKNEVYVLYRNAGKGAFITFSDNGNKI
jgi:hypothetical protein